MPLSPETPALPIVQLESLLHWNDATLRSAAANMALDEALFLWTLGSGRAAARFYVWDHPARTRGYFDPPTETRQDGIPHPSVRRFTGGGIVEHGEDVTFVLTLPPTAGASRRSAMERYRWIHEALASALEEAGIAVTLEPVDHRTAHGPCFANPVPWDLLDPASGEKRAGGAQRRTRGGVIHQGSVRLPEGLRDPGAEWVGGFLRRLATVVSTMEEAARAEVHRSGDTLLLERYATESWNSGCQKKGKEV